MFAPNLASAHNDDGYYADTGNLPDQSRWMARVSDATPITHMSIPGTHDSGSRFGPDPATTLISKTQSLTITQQLRGGIRFLDIRLRHVDNALAVHHGAVYQNAMFGGVLQEVASFLSANPSETVLMRVKQEHTEQNSTRTFAQTFRTYFNGNRGLFAKPPAESGNHGTPTLGTVRGKIVLLVDFVEPAFDELGFRYDKLFFRKQDDYALYSQANLYTKWLKVKDALGAADRDGSNHINYLSGSMGGPLIIYPYFVASGHASMGTGASRLSTGYTTPGWASTYPDFPRVDCFIGICTIAYEGTNTLTKDHINRVKPSYVGLVVADFPGAGLIRSVIETNFRMVPLLSELNGLCLDIAYGVGHGHPLTTHACHGGDNQAFRFSGEQILVGDMCLDVAGGHNVNHASVIAHPCHGGQNQKWRRNPTGTIQSLLPGPPRCLDVAAERGGAVEVVGCWISADQRFWEKGRFPTQLLVNASNGQCADIRGGVGKNHALIAFPCTGTQNQRFRFDGEQLLVGDQCLDVKGNRNVHNAEVVSHPCNGQDNQKWRLNANNTIQSLMPGEPRCVDLSTEHGNTFRMLTCWPSSQDQQFMRVPL